MKPTQAHQPFYALLAGGSAVVTATILILAKMVAWYFSGSASVLASMTDSLMDAVISVMAFLSIRASLKPADAEHRYGHGKIEGIAAMVQAAMIAGAAMFLALESSHRLVRPEPLGATDAAAWIMLFSLCATFALVAVQKFCLSRAPSLAVEADSAHYTSDILSNGAVLATLLAVSYGAPAWVDPALALCVAAWMGWTSWSVGHKGMSMLLDRELPEETRSDILRTVSGIHGIEGVHDLRTHRSGMRIFVTFDIEVEPSIPLIDAHGIARNAELALLERYPHAEIMIHVDPLGMPGDSRHHVPGVHD